MKTDKDDCFNEIAFYKAGCIRQIFHRNKDPNCIFEFRFSNLIYKLEKKDVWLKDHEKSEHHRGSRVKTPWKLGSECACKNQHWASWAAETPKLELKFHSCTLKILLYYVGHSDQKFHAENSNIYQFSLDKATFHEGRSTL